MGRREGNYGTYRMKRNCEGNEMGWKWMKWKDEMERCGAGKVLKYSREVKLVSVSNAQYNISLLSPTA